MTHVLRQRGDPRDRALGALDRVAGGGVPQAACLELADEVAECVREAARRAGGLLFPGSPVDFPLSVAVVESYDAAG